MALFPDEDRHPDPRERAGQGELATRRGEAHDRRWQTDNGDPFGDRAAGTPMRVIRGRFRRDRME